MIKKMTALTVDVLFNIQVEAVTKLKDYNRVL